MPATFTITYYRRNDRGYVEVVYAPPTPYTTRAEARAKATDYLYNGVGKRDAEWAEVHKLDTVEVIGHCRRYGE